MWHSSVEHFTARTDCKQHRPPRINMVRVREPPLRRRSIYISDSVHGQIARYLDKRFSEDTVALSRAYAIIRREIARLNPEIDTSDQRGQRSDRKIFRVSVRGLHWVQVMYRFLWIDDNELVYVTKFEAVQM